MSNASRLLARQSAVEHDAALFLAYLANCGVRFNAADKTEGAYEFTMKRAGSALAIPSKLTGTSDFQTAAAQFQSGAFGKVEYRHLVCRKVDDARPGRTGLFRLALHVEGCRLGYVADKHLGWLLPLLRFENGINTASGVSFYALAVTGGEGEKRMRGVNFCVTGVCEAVRSRYGIATGAPEDDANANHYAAELEAEALLAAQEDAYASGSASRIHALTDADFDAGHAA